MPRFSALRTSHSEQLLSTSGTAGLVIISCIRSVQQRSRVGCKILRGLSGEKYSEAVQIWDYFLPAWNNIISSNSEAGTGVCYSGTTREVYPPNRGGAGPYACASAQAYCGLQKLVSCKC